MSNQAISLDAVPATYQEGFQQLAQTLADLAGSDLVGLSAFGGRVVGDPFFEGTPARSVAVVREIDLKVLDKLASVGARLGKLNLRAPLIMTPAYIASSCDVFPLELLEIQQLHALVFGEDHFAGLAFEAQDVRLQCERELKSELVQLRQGLLAAAGEHKLLAELCLSCAERTVRILRGILHLAQPAETIQPAKELIKRVASITAQPFAALQRLVSSGREVGMAEIEGLYGEVELLASHADAWQSTPGTQERWP